MSMLLMGRPLDSVDRFLDNDFVTGILDSELSAPPFYYQRFYMKPKENATKRRMNEEAEDSSPAKRTLLRLDVRNYSPQEITVKTIGDSVEVQGRHEEESEENGYLKREFTRRRKLPKDVDPTTVTSSFSNGVLSVQAPRKETAKNVERTIPIAVEHVAAKDSTAPTVEASAKQGS